jgi:AraC family transcriptional regulator, positive regulator of tynA and feaB
VTVFSTQDVHPRDRLSYWVEVASQAFVDHSFKSHLGTAFSAEVRMTALDKLGISVFSCDACNVIRSQRDAGRADGDDLLLCLQLQGRSAYSQHDRETKLQSSSMVLVDPRRPFSIAIGNQSRTITFKIARKDLAARLGPLTDLTCRGASPSTPLTGLASGFLAMLPERAKSLDPISAGRVAEQALDLVALALAAELGATVQSRSTARSTALFRLKSAIEARLRDPGLKPAAVAAEAGISVRYANALLAQEESSIERYVLSRRLECCRRAFEDASQAHRMIGEIAFSWGFSDLSHFARRFRAAHGCTPGDYRRRAQEG